jgi:hypothetical protein
MAFALQQDKGSLYFIFLEYGGIKDYFIFLCENLQFLSKSEHFSDSCSIRKFASKINYVIKGELMTSHMHCILMLLKKIFLTSAGM